MRLLRLTIALLTVAAVAPAAAPAGTGPPLEEFPHDGGDLAGAPLSDGFRYFVLHRTNGVVRVVDAETSKRRDIKLRSACRPVSAHTGAALIECDDREFPLLLRLSTMQLVSMGDDDPPTKYVFYRWKWSLIGRHWIGGERRDQSGHPSAAWINRRTNVVRRRLDDYPSSRDHDDPELPNARLGWRPFEYEPPWFLFGVVFEPSGPEVRSPLIVRPGFRRGPRDRRLSECEAEYGCRRAALSAGLVTWAEPGIVRSYDLRRRVRYAWTIGGTPPPHVVHSRNHVLVWSGGPLSWARVRE